jgi:hypothetical protein
MLYEPYEYEEEEEPLDCLKEGLSSRKPLRGFWEDKGGRSPSKEYVAPKEHDVRK